MPIGKLGVSRCAPGKNPECGFRRLNFEVHGKFVVQEFTREKIANPGFAIFSLVNSYASNALKYSPSGRRVPIRHRYE